MSNLLSWAVIATSGAAVLVSVGRVVLSYLTVRNLAEKASRKDLPKLKLSATRREQQALYEAYVDYLYRSRLSPDDPDQAARIVEKYLSSEPMSRRGQGDGE